MRFALREYQQAAKEKVLREFERGAKSVLLSIATGGGKTIIGGDFVYDSFDRNEPVAFCVPRAELVEQTSETLDKMHIPHGVIQASHWRDFSSRSVQVCSVQTMERREGKLDLSFDFLVLDECHINLDRHIRIREIVTRANGGRRPQILGLSATPYRADGRALSDIFDALVEGPTVAELVAQGFLAAPLHIGNPTRVNLGEIPITNGEYDAGAADHEFNRLEVSGRVFDEWQKHASEVRSVAFCTSVDHAEAIARMFNEKGVSAAFIHGSMDSEKRRDTMKRFRDGEFRVLANCKVLIEGYDDPSLGCVMLINPTKSTAGFLQMVGRVLRPHPGKEHGLILDFVDAWTEHGFADDPRNISLSGGLEKGTEREAPKFRCPSCGTRLKGRPKRCPRCLEEIPERIIPTKMFERPVDLEVLQKDDTESKTYADLNARAWKHKFQPRWADVQFKKMFGKWPGKRARDGAPFPFKTVGPFGKTTTVWNYDEIRRRGV